MARRAAHLFNVLCIFSLHKYIRTVVLGTDSSSSWKPEKKMGVLSSLWRVRSTTRFYNNDAEVCGFLVEQTGLPEAYSTPKKLEYFGCTGILVA